MYNYILNEKNGRTFPCSDFYLYPLTANDYADVYRNYNVDKYPVMAFIYLTNRCPDNCIGCFASKIEDGSKFLEKEVMLNLLDDLASNGTKAIKLAGREPTAYPYLSECLFKCKELGMKSLVITSGTNIDKHIEALSTAVTHLRVSLNTISEELHNQIHRPSSSALKYNKRKEYLKEIIAKRRELGLITGATYLVRSSEDTNAYEYVQICKELGFNYVRFTLLDEDKGSWSDAWTYTYNKLLKFETEDFKIITHMPIPECHIHVSQKEIIDPAIVSRVVIHANGKVNSCHEGWRGDWIEPNMATYGNINEKSFHDIWTGEKRKKFLDYITAAHSDGENLYNCCTMGVNVCNNNCKYDGFNEVQKWIISQLEEDSESIFDGITIPATWTNKDFEVQYV